MLQSPVDVPVVPAPWTLNGDGYILLYKFSPEFAKQHGFIPAPLTDRFAGLLGAVMLVKYRSSDAGPYDELLFTPGRFHSPRGSFRSITKIYVSTWDSVINGRANWGIPKEIAQFDWKQLDDRIEQIAINHDGHLIAAFTLKTLDVKMPVTTSLLPPPWRTFVQEHEGQTLYTTPHGTGKMKPASLIEARVDPEYFPDITQGRLISAVRTEEFKLTFPVAKQ
jgi:hypothetical protein